MIAKIVKPSILIGLIIIAVAALILFRIYRPEPQKNPAYEKVTETIQRDSQASALSVTRTAGAEIIKKGTTDKTLPTDEKRAEDDARKTEQLINTWREAIVIKDKQNIEKLGMSVNSAGAEAVPFLQKLVLSDDSERVRAFAARVLGRMRKAEFAQMFRDLLENDASPFVRENAAWALGELKDVQSISKLQIVADNDASDQVRAQAKKSVDDIKRSNK